MNSFESATTILILEQLNKERLEKRNYNDEYYDYSSKGYDYNEKFGYKIANSSRKIKKLILKR